MNVVFACGGTGGHINPAIAVANILRERHPEGKILFIGGAGAMEEELVPKAGYEIVTFEAGCMWRGLSWDAFRRNIRTVGQVVKGFDRCRKILKEFGADAVVGTGGYVSFPPLLAARTLGIPTCVHESNALPGLTTRLLAGLVDEILVCFPESAKAYRHSEKVRTVGMPVRREFIYTNKDQAREALGLDDRPLIVSTFGSQGARDMNRMVAELFRLEQEAGFPFRHIHAVGAGYWEQMCAAVRDRGVDLKNGAIEMRRYIYDMPTVMAAADVMIGRAGAGTCNEIAASGTPCILIPSPNVTDNHQEKNARALADRGGAVLLLEKDCTPQKLFQELNDLLADRDRRRRMRTALCAMAVPDSAERICDIVEKLAGKGRKV